MLFFESQLNKVWLKVSHGLAKARQTLPCLFEGRKNLDKIFEGAESIIRHHFLVSKRCD